MFVDLYTILTYDLNPLPIAFLPVLPDLTLICLGDLVFIGEVADLGDLDSGERFVSSYPNRGRLIMFFLFNAGKVYFLVDSKASGVSS